MVEQLVLVAVALVPSALMIYQNVRADKRLDRIENEHMKERAAWDDERRELITRIQTPEVAKVLDMPEPTDEPTYLPFDDDEAWHEYRDDRLAGRLK